MFFLLSKIVPPFIYPLGLACLALGLGLLVRRREVLYTRLVTVALLVLWLGGNRIVATTLARSLEWRHIPPSASGAAVPQADVIVVLGASARARAFPRPMAELDERGSRLLQAARLYRQGAADRVLLSGGNVPWFSSPSEAPEAETMADVLAFMGVPREAMWLEPNSRNTHENAVETQRILESQGVNRVILVTSAMHMPRSYRVFQKTDLEVIPLPADYLVSQDDWDSLFQPDPVVQLLNLLPSARYLHMTTDALKEVVGIAVYWLRGWL
jgi:uncharacterized SAM-binding protein YcdF (DUF218 family)